MLHYKTHYYWGWQQSEMRIEAIFENIENPWMTNHVIKMTLSPRNH